MSAAQTSHERVSPTEKTMQEAEEAMQLSRDMSLDELALAYVRLRSERSAPATPVSLLSKQLIDACQRDGVDDYTKTLLLQASNAIDVLSLEAVSKWEAKHIPINLEERVSKALARLGCDGYDWREYIDNGMARAAIAAMGCEPVAWQYRYEIGPGKWTAWTLKRERPFGGNQFPDCQVQPLYTAPPLPVWSSEGKPPGLDEDGICQEHGRFGCEQCVTAFVTGSSTKPVAWEWECLIGTSPVRWVKHITESRPKDVLGARNIRPLYAAPPESAQPTAAISSKNGTGGAA